MAFSIDLRVISGMIFIDKRKMAGDFREVKKIALFTLPEILRLAELPRESRLRFSGSPRVSSTQ